MLQWVSELIKKPFKILIILIIFFLVFPYFLGEYYGKSFIEKIEISLVSFLVLVAITEMAFRIIYKITFGLKYQFIKKIPFKSFSVEPHPYLPYIRKKNFKSFPSERLNYPLHKNYYSAAVSTNNFSFNNGLNGNRDIKVPKPKNLIRINCLGGSTTADYISYKNKNYSYPLELEKILKLKTRKNIEVNNCGAGGYNSADLLVRLMLQIIDTSPNYIVIYHAYNDIKSYLTKNFKSDYSHSVKNLGETYWKFALGSKIPDVPLNFINYLKNKWLPSNHRYSLIEVISKGKFNPKLNFHSGLKIYERNIQSMIDLCIKNKIKVVLCTYCFYLHKEIKSSSLHNLYKKIVIEENKVMKKLAKKNKVKLVDCFANISREDSNFVDSIHFTPKGMKLLSRNISKAIKI